MEHAHKKEERKRMGVPPLSLVVIRYYLFDTEEERTRKYIM